MSLNAASSAARQCPLRVPLRALRNYSHQTHTQDPNFRLKAFATTTYVVGAVTLPFVPPILETRRSRKDGTYLTKPPIEFTPGPKY